MTEITALRPMVPAAAPAASDAEVLPHNIEAEQALLGAVLFKNNALHLVVDMIRPTDFYLPAHQLIFTAFLDLYHKNHPVDLVTVMEVLRARGDLEKAGGAGYLADLSSAMLSAVSPQVRPLTPF